jgi:hypothetical protein
MQPYTIEPLARQHDTERPGQRADTASIDREIAAVEHRVDVGAQQQSVIEAVLTALRDWPDVRRLQHGTDLGLGNRTVPARRAVQESERLTFNTCCI